jgi:hypothetical protein
MYFLTYECTLPFVASHVLCCSFWFVFCASPDSVELSRYCLNVSNGLDIVWPIDSKLRVASIEATSRHVAFDMGGLEFGFC